jgi:hypothetical protein
LRDRDESAAAFAPFRGMFAPFRQSSLIARSYSGPPRTISPDLQEDPMTVLSFAKYMAEQATENSCWACAARSILNFRAGKILYRSDQALADAYAKKAGKPAYKDIDKMRSAADALHVLGMPGYIDEAPIPKPAELEDEFAQSKPLLSIVGNVDPQGQPNRKYQEGHWVVLIGIDAKMTTLAVFDPEDGEAHAVPYDAATYKPGVYWQNTTYF